jgi:hypothetical protein
VMVMTVMGSRGAIDLALDSPPVRMLARVCDELSLKLGAPRSNIQNAF